MRNYPKFVLSYGASMGFGSNTYFMRPKVISNLFCLVCYW